MWTDLRQGRQEQSIAGGGTRRKIRNAEEWVWVFQEHLRALALDPRMSKAHWRVLAYVVSYATFAQDMTLKQKDLAEGLGLAFQTISRVLGELGTIGILTRVSGREIPATYRLNSLYVYKGHGERRPGRLAQQRKERGRAQAL